MKTVVHWMIWPVYVHALMEPPPVVPLRACRGHPTGTLLVHSCQTLQTQSSAQFGCHFSDACCFTDSALVLNYLPVEVKFKAFHLPSLVSALRHIIPNAFVEDQGATRDHDLRDIGGRALDSLLVCAAGPRTVALIVVSQMGEVHTCVFVESTLDTYSGTMCSTTLPWSPVHSRPSTARPVVSRSRVPMPASQTTHAVLQTSSLRG